MVSRAVVFQALRQPCGYTLIYLTLSDERMAGSALVATSRARSLGCGERGLALPRRHGARERHISGARGFPTQLTLTIEPSKLIGTSRGQAPLRVMSCSTRSQTLSKTI